MLRGESWKGNYGLLSLEKVRYGLDEGSADFKELCWQLAQQYLLMAVRAGHHFDSVEPNFQKIWVESHLIQKLSYYCAIHKDPCYEDEREMRIIALPIDKAESRIFTGIASMKKIHFKPDGKPYIRLGEYWHPSMRPRQLIVGTKASQDLGVVLSRYETSPVVANAGLPVA